MKSISDNLKLSVLDLFSILLPGIIMEALLYQLPCMVTLVKSLFHNISKEWQVSIALFIAAYIIGHIVYYIGSFWDIIVHKKIYEKNWDNTKMNDLITGIKKQKIGIADITVINNYKWCRAEFIIRYPAVYSVVEGFEASSKFFRSLTGVMSIGIFIFLYLNQFIFMTVCLVMAIIAFIMYVHLRKKAIRTAYEHIITIYGKSDQ